MSNKTIVHLTPSYFPQVGGVEKHLLELNKVLVERGYQVSVIAATIRNDLPSHEDVEGVEVFRFLLPAGKPDFLSKTKYKLLVWANIAKKLPILWRADAIQIHDVFFWLLPFLLIIPRRKLFMTFHGYEGGSGINRRQRFWHRAAAMLTSKNICIGSFHQKWYRVKADEISYGAVETEANNQSFKKKPKYQLAYIGRLSSDTGIMAYLNALKILQQNNSRYHLDIFGDGPMMDQAQKFTENHHLNARFFGFIPNASAAASKYRMVFVSGYLSILETLAAGTGVIAYFNNPLRKEYLVSSPFAKWIGLAESPEQIVKLAETSGSASPKAIKLSRKQTWGKLAGQYEKIWGV